MSTNTLFSKYSRICNNCNKPVYYSDKYNLQIAIDNNKFCRRCMLAIRNKSISKKKEENSQWKGYKEIPFNWFSRYFLRRRKNRKNKEGDISIEQIYNLWIKQNKKCALSGIDIGFYDILNEKNELVLHSCSIDRIDSSIGYTIDNVQLVHKDVNFMKLDFDMSYFINMCKLIAKNNEK